MFPYSSLLFIVNGRARKGYQVIEEIQQAMAKLDMDYQILKTEGPHFFQGIKSILRKKDPDQNPLTVVVGGDGTLNYFTSLMEKEGLDQPIAYLPAGAGNDFARSMGLSMDIKEGIHHILSVESSRSLDMIKAYDSKHSSCHLAINSIGFGLDGLTNYYINQPFSKVKSSLGQHAYLPLAALAYSRQKEFKVELSLDGSEPISHQEVKLCVILNNPYFGGGVNIYPPAQNDDQLLHILLADQVKHKDLLAILHQLFIKKQSINHPKIHMYHFKQARLNIVDSVYGQKDGESLLGPCDLDIKLIQRDYWI